MRFRYSVLFVVVVSVVGMSLWSAAAAVPANSVVPLSKVSAVVALGDTEEDVSYIGSKKCKKCHLKQYKSWESLKHGAALTLLEPGQASEAKSAHNLDSGKDYTKDDTCLTCHAVGFGKPGGYAVPTDEKAAKKAKSLAGVGCEACHGPGGGYIKVQEEIKKSKRTYKPEEMYDAGLVKADESVCVKCHNDKGPTFDSSKPFDFETAKDSGVHEHYPLKQREE